MSFGLREQRGQKAVAGPARIFAGGCPANSCIVARLEGEAECIGLGILQLGLIIYALAGALDAQSSATLFSEKSVMMFRQGLDLLFCPSGCCMHIAVAIAHKVQLVGRQ